MHERDVETVLRWAIHDVRVRDLPAEVAFALRRLEPEFPRDEAGPRTTAYTEGRYRLTVFPDGTGAAPMLDSRPLAPGRALDEALEHEPLYVLLVDVGRAEQLEAVAA